MTQYTDSFLRVPATYPQDMAWNDFDPYLDGAYTAEPGDDVGIYLLEREIRSTFRALVTITPITAVFNPTLIQAVTVLGELKPIEVRFPSLASIYQNNSLFINFSLMSLAFAMVAPVDSGVLSLIASNPILASTFSPPVLTIADNIDTIVGSFNRSILAVSIVESTLETSAIKATFTATFTMTTLQTIFELIVA